MAYKVHPTSTVSTSFSVSGAASVDLAINEDVDSADDGAKYAYANSAGDDFEVLLEEPPFTPSIGSGHVVRFRAKGGGTGAAAQLIVYLIDRSVVPEVTLYEGEKITLSSSFSTYEVDLGLTEPLADYSSLSLLVTDSGPAGEMRVNLSALEFKIPSVFEISGAISSSSSLTAAMGGVGALSGSCAASSVAAASMSGSGAMAGVIAATSSLAASAMLMVSASGTIAATSSLSAAATGTGSVAGRIDATATLSASFYDGSDLGPWETLSNLLRERVQSQVIEPLKLGAAYDNAVLGPISETRWVRVAVRPGESDQLTMESRPVFRKSGELVCSIMAPLGEGDGPSLSIADSIIDALRAVKYAQVTFELPQIELGRRDGAFWRTDVRMSFRADFQLDRVAGSAPLSLSSANAAAVLRSRFHDVATVAHGIEVQYDGEDDVGRDPTELWARFSVLHGATTVAERRGDSRTYRTVGLGSALIFVPLETGELSALRLADQIAQHFRSVSDRGVTFKTPLVSGTQRAGAWWQVSVTCPFQWDQIA